MTHPLPLALLVLFLLTPALCGAGTTLHGLVVLVGSRDELVPAEGVPVAIEETGDSERTRAGGLFDLYLREDLLPGVRITLQVIKEGWRIQYPLDGELRIPVTSDIQRIEVRLLPVGSKKWWSDDRIEKLIADMAAQSWEQITPDAAQPPPDFGRYIQEWATQYGFSLEQAQAEIARWAAEVEQHQDDPYELGLAAFAKKQFARAQQLFRDSAATNVERMRQSAERIAAEQEQREHYREAAIRDYRLEGDAAFNHYAFAPALEAYENALALTNREQRPQQWAEVIMDVARAHHEIGIRAEGEAVQKNLAEAVAAYRAALEVYTRAQLPQDWAMTQNNLGVALQEQGIRTGGEGGPRLLAEAVAAHRAALEVRDRAQMPQDWAMTQTNLGNALQEQGTRTGGEAGQRLLAEAVAAYRAALEVFTLEHTGPYWVQTTSGLVDVLEQMEDSSSLAILAAGIGNRLRFEPDDIELYNLAIYICHDTLFDFPAAERISIAWLEQYPDDLDTRCTLAEAFLTVGRLEEAVVALGGPLSPPSNGDDPRKGALGADKQVAMRLLEIVAQAGLGDRVALAAARDKARALLLGQADSFEVDWNFRGTRHFVATDPLFEGNREQLLALLDAAGKDRGALLSALQEIAIEHPGGE